MSIDIVTVEDGLITHVYHLEDRTGAVAQLTAEWAQWGSVLATLRGLTAPALPGGLSAKGGGPFPAAIARLSVRRPYRPGRHSAAR